MLRVKEKGTYKVVTAPHELETWTNCGWRLVAVLENSTVQPWTDIENVPIAPNPGYNNSGYGNPGIYPNPPYITESRAVTRNHTVRSQSFLLQDEESVVTALNYKMSEYEAKLHEKDKITKDQELKLKELLNAYVNFKAEVIEKLTQAEAILERDKERRRTSYERVVQGDFDETVETFEAGGHG